MKRLAIALSLLVLLVTPCYGQTLQPVKIAELIEPFDKGGHFARSLAVDDGLALVGTPFGQPSGNAYLFDALSGSLLVNLAPPDGLNEDWFGVDVAIDNGMALVGSPAGDETAAYLYEASTGNLLFKLTPEDPVSTGPSNDFGYSVAIDGKHALVGDRAGAAYLFDVHTGTQIARLVVAGQSISDRLVQSVALDDRYALIGTPFTPENEPGGAAHLFDLQTLEEIAVYRKPDAPRYGEFGGEVAIDNGAVLIASTARLNSEPVARPVAPVQLIDAAASVTIAELSPDMAPPINGYGRSLAVDDGIVVVGSPSESQLGGTNSVYFFAATTGDRLGVIRDPSTTDGSALSIEVAIDGDLVLAASPGRRSVIVYRLVPEPTAALLIATAALADLSRRR